eukprot:10829772-Lingulodinium_polyedra.AAC.1
MALPEAGVPQRGDDGQQHAELCELQPERTQRLPGPWLRREDALQAPPSHSASQKALLHGRRIHAAELAKEHLVPATESPRAPGAGAPAGA